MHLFVDVKGYVLVTIDFVPSTHKNIILIALFLNVMNFCFKFGISLYANWSF
jgi:hypothetical protein